MQQNRKDYRKKFTSTGELFLAGELLTFISYDVSVNGVQVELLPGEFIHTVSDVRDILNDTYNAQVFVQDLKLSAEAHVVWVREEQGKIFVGLEFGHVRHNAEKLWMQRSCYRKDKVTDASVQLHDLEFKVQTINVSAKGMRFSCDAEQVLEHGDVLKLSIPAMKIKTVASVVWVNRVLDHDFIEFGVRYFKVT